MCDVRNMHNARCTTHDTRCTIWVCKHWMSPENKISMQRIYIHTQLVTPLINNTPYANCIHPNGNALFWFWYMFFKNTENICCCIAFWWHSTYDNGPMIMLSSSWTNTVRVEVGRCDNMLAANMFCEQLETRDQHLNWIVPSCAACVFPTPSQTPSMSVTKYLRAYKIQIAI